VEFLAPTPYYTVVVPATALGGLTVGAFDAETNSLYSKTSWGPTRLPVMSPDFVAPGVDVGGVYPTGYGTMSGTSVASAITTGAGALMLQWGIVEGNDPSLSTYQIKAFIIRGCTRESNIVYPNTQWGYGRLNLIQSFNVMREA
jgi:subtilisin family serine protease